ncbi:MAG: spore germination protein [Clostridiales bacterium]|nr:spore germination protein [Clostridiales bacterium]
MNLKQGRIGVFEGVCLAAAALCVNGVFGLDPEYAYSKGNSTYLSLPLALMLALEIMLLLIKAAERTGSRDLAELMTDCFGGVLGVILTIPVLAGFVFCAARPMTAFLEVLHRLIYDGVGYTSILAYVIPVTVFIAWKGFESMGRLAAVFAGIMLAAFVFAAVSAAPDFEVYRLYPLIGEGPGRFAAFTLSELVFFIPPLLGLLVNAKGLSGLAFVKKISFRAAIFAAVICGVTQLCVALIYPYGILSGLLMPLYRLNFLNLAHSYALRLDKIFIMIWLNGCIITAAYCIYSAALLYSKLFRQRDVTPAAAAFSLIVCGTVLAKAGKSFGFVYTADRFLTRYGAAAAAFPAVSAALVGLIKKRKVKA